MKRLLSIIGAISLVGTSSTSLVACNTPQYSEDELKKLKEKHKIDTNNQEIRDNLEWIAPQEKPFINVDNKYYFIVWRGNENNHWKLSKFKNDTNVNSSQKTIDNLENKYYLNLGSYLDIRPINIYIYKQGFTGFAYLWVENNNYFKSVYRWNLDTQEPDLIIDENGNVKVNE